MTADSLDRIPVSEIVDRLASGDLTPEELADIVDSLSDSAVSVLLSDLGGGVLEEVPGSPLEQAIQLDDGYAAREHLVYLSDRLAQAVADVEAGQSRRVIVEMPPRSGKTTMATIFTPLWALRLHPDWPIALISHDGTLAKSWGRQIRRHVEGSDLGVRLAPDAGAVGAWETINGGSVFSASHRESFTGRGAKVLVVDDPHKDFADAHSAVSRASIWNWWLSVAQTRLEAPDLVIVIMTRWHEDDLVGRLLSEEYEGDPSEWEVIRLPAIADSPADPIGRAEGEPLLSPLVEENLEQALERWERIRRSVGSYTWDALMQQNPSSPRGAIFDHGWWRYWTTDPEKASRMPDGAIDPNGRVVLFDPATAGREGRWLDSWDMAFKATDASDFVVGQRWCRVGPRKYLVAQSRARRSFSDTLAVVRRWANPRDPLVPFSDRVHERVVEDKANGTAVIDTLKSEISGLIPINPTDSKVARARAVSVDVEAADVFLPLPSDPGNEWVTTDYLPEFREFPTGAHDDQVDATTQALSRLRTAGTTEFHRPQGRIDRAGQMKTAASSKRSRVVGGRIVRRGYR